MIDKIAWIHIKDGKILSTLSKGKNTYYLPGGKRQEFENDVETLIREIKEELSIDICKSTIRYYDAFIAQAHGKLKGISVKMSCYMASYTGDIVPSNEINKIVWLTHDDMNKISAVDKLIFKDLYKRGLID